MNKEEILEKSRAENRNKDIYESMQIQISCKRLPSQVHAYDAVLYISPKMLSYLH